MDLNWKISSFKPYEPGVFLIRNGIRFAAEFSGNNECGIILYDSKGQKTKIPFSQEGRCGNLYGIQIEGVETLPRGYQFYDGNDIVMDSYAQTVHGLEKWGGRDGGKRPLCAGFDSGGFDWEGDAPLGIPYEDTILYGLNVRAFTMHKSSGVIHRGTFEGVIEKIPYLKSLGITAVLLMPCYEYEECMTLPAGAGTTVLSIDGRTGKEAEISRLDCWGFRKGFYFAPKASYSAGASPVHSFQQMVKELHQNGIEVMMHFYFPPEVKQSDILRILKHWVLKYHIDGARVSGFHIPFRMLMQEGFLSDTKIWCDYIPDEEKDGCHNVKNFSFSHGNYKNDMRRFLKGDEGFVGAVLNYQRQNPADYGVINYFADYDGFSLYDCVSYERKHNELNGEENRDGAERNYTWNCGIEGETRKKAVRRLRLKQLKNALALLFFSQGTPFLFSGDEFGNSRRGNNNCYCQDNASGWIEWKETDFAKELLSYTRFLIGLRREYRILHMKREMSVMDTKSCGYPDISYHGIEAWRPDLGHMSRIFGTMLCGQYAGEEPFFYIACNMHWESHRLALPKLPPEQAWVKISDTSDCDEENSGKDISAMTATESVIIVNARSIVLFRSVPVPSRGKPRGRKQKGSKSFEVKE
ncbi:MAG: alpha-amylase family glycosyl hydrolase [Lachnospiraceae bacterium]|nr:alpha-amylase family glycosyl hydrolase [Lachnospiraceae bacterium]